ncbi:3870_t:CDS:2 [Entrophospora sp. SA101]|nr:3870_t:CDS:2 [Entrophospora sp. SA101]
MDVTSEHYESFNEAEDNEGFDTGNTSNDTQWWNQKYNKKNDNKSFKRHMSTENIGTDNNNSLASIDELQNEITKLKRNRNSYNVLMTGKRFRI